LRVLFLVCVAAAHPQRVTDHTHSVAGAVTA
jgi:hypothetical protein